MPAAYAEAAAAAGESLHEHLTRLAAAAGDRRARAGRARLALGQPLGARRPRALRARRRADAGHPARGRLPRAARGHRLRHPRHRRDLPRQRRAGRGVHRRRRPRQEPAAHADLRRRHPPPALDHRLRAGPRARLGDPRRRRRRAPTPTCRPRPSRWARCAATSTCPTRRARAAYDPLFEQYVALHDHFGRATTTMRRLKAIRRDAVARRAAASTATRNGGAPA